MTKPLFVMVSDGGDGSYSTVFTLDAAWIARQEQRYDNDTLEHGDIGVDGDGFHYSTIQVPDDATYKSLGISYYVELGEDEEEDNDDCES